MPFYKNEQLVETFVENGNGSLYIKEKNIIMTASDRVVDYTEYDIRLQLSKGCYVVGVRFDKRWKVLKPSDERVRCMPSNTEKDDSVFYVADIETGTDPIYDAIDETIAYNIEAQMKIDLFKAKVKELQEIFSTEDYARLATLEFKMKNKAGRRPKKKDGTEKATSEEKNVDNSDASHEEACATENTTDEVVANPVEAEDIDEKIKMALTGC